MVSKRRASRPSVALADANERPRRGKTRATLRKTPPTPRGRRPEDHRDAGAMREVNAARARRETLEEFSLIAVARANGRAGVVRESKARGVVTRVDRGAIASSPCPTSARRSRAREGERDVLEQGCVRSRRSRGRAEASVGARGEEINGISARHLFPRDSDGIPGTERRGLENDSAEVSECAMSDLDESTIEKWIVFDDTDVGVSERAREAGVSERQRSSAVADTATGLERFDFEVHFDAVFMDKVRVFDGK